MIEFLKALFGFGRMATAAQPTTIPGRIVGRTPSGRAIYASAADYPWEPKRWPSFKPEEFDCKGTGRIALDPVALDMLQRLRTYVGKPFIVVSAYRSPEHNAAVGGAKTSKHMDGIAFDIAMRGIDQEAFILAAEKVGFTGIGKYRTFTHIDTRERKARWKG